MKKLLLLILIIGTLFSNELIEDSLQVVEKERHELFQKQKKSPLIACALSLTPEFLAYVGAFDPEIYITLYGLPALGHKYSNNWKRGALIGLGITGMSFYGVFSIKLGYTILGVGYLLQIQDAIYLTKKYNAELYNNIYDKKYPKKLKKSILSRWFNPKSKTSNNTFK